MSDVEMFLAMSERSIAALAALAKQLLAEGRINQAEADAITGEAAKARRAAYQLGLADAYERSKGVTTRAIASDQGEAAR